MDTHPAVSFFQTFFTQKNIRRERPGQSLRIRGEMKHQFQLVPAKISTRIPHISCGFSHDYKKTFSLLKDSTTPLRMHGQKMKNQLTTIVKRGPEDPSLDFMKTEGQL